MSCWQPSSAGVTDLRAMSAFASSSVSFANAGPSGALRAGAGGNAARDDGTDARLDGGAQRGARADQEVRFRAHEQRADEKLAHVVEERGLHALEAVAEELQRPAGDEERRRHAERAGGAQAREGLARRG